MNFLIYKASRKFLVNSRIWNYIFYESMKIKVWHITLHTIQNPDGKQLLLKVYLMSVPKRPSNHA